MKIRPFRDSDTFTAFSNLVEKVKQEIRSLDDDYVLGASKAELEAYYAAKTKIDPLTLHPDQAYIAKQSNTRIDVSRNPFDINFLVERTFVHGTQLDIAIPFEGHADLWRLRPSTYTLGGYPMVEVHDGYMVLPLKFPHGSASAQGLRGEIDNDVQSLQSAIDNLRADVEKHNSTAIQAVMGTLHSRISTAQATAGAISALGIPIKRRDEPLTYSVPTNRRQSPIRPKTSTQPYKREPVLDMAEYDYILDIMRSMSLVMERNPSAFSTLDEEAIRTHFLLQLNGHYEGNATGETFNASGKTDILIRVENRNIFIAECKFWKGPKYFNDAIDQILSYLTWRDTKCALFVFNKTRDSSVVRQKMHQVMQTRTECKKVVFNIPDGDSRYVFVKDSDPGKEIIIATQLYDIPA